MNAHTMALEAYASATQPIRSDKDTEYDAFVRVTHALQAVSTDTTAGAGALARAIYDNRRLWSLLAADVASEGNALSQSLRARIFYLAQFTQAHSRKVLKGEETLGPLIEINTAIMRGLRQRGAGE